MRSSSTPHVAVIGAGVFGVWTAYALLEAGARVTLVDAWGPGNTLASSGGESRILRCVYGGDDRYARMTLEALDRWKAFEEKWEATLFRQTGAAWLFSVEDDSYVRDALPGLGALGWPLEELALADLSDRFPALSTQGLKRAYWEPRAGLLHARLAVQRVAAACRHLGADYREAAARPGSFASDRLEEVRLSDGSRLEADTYVFACGPWLRNLFPELLQDPTAISRQEVFFFRTPPGANQLRYPDLPIWVEFGETFFYGLPYANHRGFKVADDDRSQPFDPDRDDRLPDPRRLRRARAFLKERFPVLAKAPLQESRVCQYLNSMDGHFIIDRHPEAGNVWLAGAGTGHGFKMGPAVGAFLSDTLLADRPTEDVFSLARFEAQDKGSFNQFAWTTDPS